MESRCWRAPQINSGAQGSLCIAAALSIPDNLKTNDQNGEESSLPFFHLSTMSFLGKPPPDKTTLPSYLLLSSSLQVSSWGEGWGKYSTVLCWPLCSSDTKCAISPLYSSLYHTSPCLPDAHTWTSQISLDPCSVLLKLLGFLAPSFSTESLYSRILHRVKLGAGLSYKSHTYLLLCN